MKTGKKCILLWVAIAAIALIWVVGCGGDAANDVTRPTRTVATDLATTGIPGPTAITEPSLTPSSRLSDTPADVTIAEITPTLVPTIAPCKTKECTPEGVSGPDLFSSPVGMNSASLSPEESPSVEETLEQGLGLAGLSPVHLAIRGVVDAGSVRCELRGVARTPTQREEQIRFWLGLSEDAALPSPSEAERLLLAELDAISPIYPETLKANFRSLAQGGLSSEYSFFICYADYIVHEYLLGSGPAIGAKFTVAYDRLAERRSYELYARAQREGEFGSESLLTEAEYEAETRRWVEDGEFLMSLLLELDESVLFLAPMGAHNAIAAQAWQVVAQWHLELVDGVVQAVRYGAGDHDEEYSQPLVTLKSRITTAAASDKFAGKRIASTEGLEAYYREIGAYDDITPGDGLDNPFTPAQPPPVPPCVTGGAVADPGANRHQVHDCQALLAAQEGLGGAALNWSPTLPLPIWDGVTMDGPDGSVVKLDLSGRGLAGILPPELGRLYGLEELWLRNNRLSGAIPPELGLLGGLQYLVLDGNRLSGAVPDELGELEALEGLRLSGNRLSGCLPAGLRAVEDSDLAGMGLRYCDRIPPPPTGFRGAPYFSGSVQLNWDAMPGVDAYQVQRLVEGGVGGWYRAGPDLTGILFGNSYNFGPGCGRHYQYRVLSRGDGQTYDAVWSAPSEAISVPTNPCP